MLVGHSGLIIQAYICGGIVRHPKDKAVRPWSSNLSHLYLLIPIIVIIGITYICVFIV
jgi:hypothetical protein